jgi:CheY-like chemotaxis protein
VPNPEPRTTGSETILVVEDDDQVRAFTTAVLVQEGYRVEATDSGPAALAACDRLPAPPDLVLTDVVMPGMSGRELAEALTARFPRLKVVFLSGYTADAVLRHGVEEERVAFLQKPYTPAALARFVREVLDGTAGTWS